MHYVAASEPLRARWRWTRALRACFHAITGAARERTQTTGHDVMTLATPSARATGIAFAWRAVMAVMLMAAFAGCSTSADGEATPTATLSATPAGTPSLTATPGAGEPGTDPTSTSTVVPTASPTFTTGPPATATNGPAASLVVAAGEPFTLRVGDRFQLANTALEAVFISVDGDSRCPTDVQCIRAGDARVVLARTSQPGGMLSIAVPPQGGADAELGGWRVTALGLEPAPISTRDLSQSDYAVRLVIVPEEAATRAIPVQVMFSRRPQSDLDPSAVFPVDRTADDIAVARFVTDELLVGPTLVERNAGYFSTWTNFGFANDSDCGSRYEITISQGVATLRFCVTVTLLGAVADGQASSAMTATLEQFSTVDRVRILDREGRCMFDLSGLDRCLE